MILVLEDFYCCLPLVDFLAAGAFLVAAFLAAGFACRKSVSNQTFYTQPSTDKQTKKQTNN